MGQRPRPEHPEWYARDWKGDFPTPWWDWDDIIDLDYSHEGLRAYMTAAMVHLVREVGVDGYRCDVAGFVPVDFWEQVRRELDEVKPVFMLAEWETRDLHTRAFDATYAWSWNETMHRIAHGKTDLDTLKAYYAWNDRAYQRDAYRMTFVSNHDKNASGRARSTSSSAPPCTPPSCSPSSARASRSSTTARRPAATSVWSSSSRTRSPGATTRRVPPPRPPRPEKAHPALWNGAAGGRMVRIGNSREAAVLSFFRRQGDDLLVGVSNLSAADATVTLGERPDVAGAVDALRGGLVDLTTPVTLPAWGYPVVRPG